MPPPSSVHDGDFPTTGPSGTVAGPHQAAPVVRRTLPPPEWLDHEGPRSAASLALERFELDTPVPRRTGPRAELAALRARLSASGSGDEAERSAAVALARALATRGTELELATKLSRRALLLGDDPALREELAGWFATLGESALAAVTLRPMADARKGAERATLLVRVAVLEARAGEARAAADALEQAIEAHSADPVPHELLASIAAWAPDAVDAARASDAYLVASERREAMSDRAAAFENLIRAFEIAPGHAPALERLVAALEQRGRRGARDEARREHGKALGAAGRSVHLERLRQALQEDDLAAALGAAFDARLDADIDLRSALSAIDPIEGVDDGSPLGFDSLLERAGIHELLAARVELACDYLAGRERARARVALGKLYDSALARPERAVDAWIDAVVSDPGNPDAKDCLRRYMVATRDCWPLVEALVRVGGARVPSSSPEREECLRELMMLAEEKLADPSLALWAAKHLEPSAAESGEVREAVSRLAPMVSEQDAELARARAALEQAAEDERVPLLTRIATFLAGRPDEAETYLGTLRELVRLFPDDRAHALALERVLTREGRFDELEAILARSSESAPGSRARLSLSAIKRRRGDLDGALRELSPSLDEQAGQGAAWSMALLLAAQRGEQLIHARALLRIASSLVPSVRAVLSALAAEALLDAGQVDAARAAAEQACNAEPSLTRPIAARAAVGGVTRDRWGADALEKAMGAIVPRAASCAALAEIYDSIGEPLLATAWSQRRVALRPGDLEAARDRLRRAMNGGEGSRLADTLAWLLSQPQPLTKLAELIAEALLELAALAPGRASALARRALDVLGARFDSLRKAVLTVADKVGERGLGIAALERWIATGSFEGSRSALLLELARRRRNAGDADGAARALLRAVREGAAARDVMAELDAALPTRSSDGELCLAEARAEALSALAEADPLGTARAWRELGGALIDLAGDRDGGLRAWERAVSLNSERGVENFAADTVAFVGFDAAFERLLELAARQKEPQQKARCLAMAASVALGSGRRADAFAVAVRALGHDPSRADVLAVAERAAADDDIDALDEVYDNLALASLGTYGERAAHYRAARQLERRGLSSRALRHAVQAFECVPSEGVVFITMARLADRSGERSEVVRAIERVALANHDADARAAWLRRAAQFTGSSEEGQRQRVDVLLRALSVRGDTDLVRTLARAMNDLAVMVPEDRDVFEMRYGRAVTELLRKIEGPEGARIAIEIALGAVNTFGAGEVALSALTRAMGCDGDLEEYESLFPVAEAIARVPESEAFIEHVLELGGNRFASAGPHLLELAARIADKRGDRASQARLLVQAACKNPENIALVRRAEAAAQRLGDPHLLEQVLGAVPLRDRVSALLELASAAERSGNLEQAADALSRALDIEEIESEERVMIVDRALPLYVRAGLQEKLEALVREVVGRADLPLDLQVRALRSLDGASLELWRKLARRAPDDVTVLEETAKAAERASDHETRARVLGRLIELEDAAPLKLPRLRELARLLDQTGDRSGALGHWQNVHALDPRDGEALAALERDAERRGDYEALVQLLGQRAVLAPLVEEVRRIRLRRAALLDQQLGRADEARAELEALLGATGDHLAVLLTLAALDERLGAPLRAAPLWMRASALATDRGEAADCACRACEGYLAAGDVEAATRVLGGIEAWAGQQRFLELAVKVERQRGRPRVLGETLDELASSSSASAEQRALWLVEAAQAFLAAGDENAARSRASRAAELAPDLAAAQLLARSLEYSERGAGSAEQARETVAELRALGDSLSSNEAELRAFLVAEALDVAASGSGVGLRELERARQQLGLLPLIGLGIGERLAASGQSQRALSGFDAALGGDLRNLRKRARVALLAAESARLSGERDRAEAYFELAVSDPETFPLAESGLRTLREERLLEASRAAVPEVVSAPPPPAPPLYSAPPVPPPPPPLYESKLPEGAGRYSAQEERVEEVAPVRSVVPTPPPAVLPPLPTPMPVPLRAGSSRAPASAPAPTTPRVTTEPPASGPEIEAMEELGDDDVAPGSPGRYSLRPEPDLTPVSLPRPAFPGDPLAATFMAVSTDESALHQALKNGSVEAGRDLIVRLVGRADRVHDLVNVCRRVATLRPGDVEILRQLHNAAKLDRDHAYVAAIEHVFALLEPQRFSAQAPPLISDLPEQPDAVRAMLFRDVGGPVLEALSLVWEGAEHVFRRDTSAYGLTGLERVPLTAPSPLARVYSGAARALGMTRTPLFQRRSAGAVTVNLALLSPPAIVLSGEVHAESAELRFHLGAMLAAALPQFALLFGAPESQARSVLRGLTFAFGPPRPTPASLGPVLNLAELLWESIPARLQRRLRELCDNPDTLDYDVAMPQARVAAHRAGLFVSGDFHVAVREVCADENLDAARVATPGGLFELCKQSASLASLYALAVSPEYAETRWRSARTRQTGPYAS
jgi:cellulose synthase operon protein C